MLNADVKPELKEKAFENFEQIKESIKGVYNVLKITLPKKDIYFKLGLDNVLALYKNLLEMLSNDPGTKELMKKLRSSELEIDIPLDF
jgi:hypothetical protein